ncbi:ABC transporter permease [Stetteria hydrogenophila]
MTFRVILWKELLDLSRDRRTLASTVLLPLLGLPLLAALTGALTGVSRVSVGVFYEDEEAAGFAGWLAGQLNATLARWGLQTRVAVARGPPGSLAGYDVVVLLPRGFAANYTSLDRVAWVRVSVLAGSPAAEAVRGAVEQLIAAVSSQLARERVERLASMAGVEVDPGAVLAPVRVSLGYHRPTGAPAPGEAAEAAAAARVLEFSLAFAVNPAVVYVSDAIVGERERRTIEALLVAAGSRRSLLAGKIVASALLGLVAAAADTVGVVAYFKMVAPAGLRLTPGLIAAHAGATAILVVMTASLTAPVAARSGSVRAAQASSFAILMLALAVYFAALTVDFLKLEGWVRLALYLVPFTHLALVIHRYVMGDVAGMLLHAAAAAAFTAASLAAAVKAFDSEKLILIKK